jgi:hypothetical protein
LLNSLLNTMMCNSRAYSRKNNTAFHFLNFASNLCSDQARDLFVQ